MAFPHRCPTCLKGLDFVDGTRGRAWACPRCLGTGATLSLLSEHGNAARLSSLASSIAGASTVSHRLCPACDEAMVTFSSDGPEVNVELDACRDCGIVWFDYAELKQMGLSLHAAAAAVAAPAQAPAQSPTPPSSSGRTDDGVWREVAVLDFILGLFM